VGVTAPAAADGPPETDLVQPETPTE
jgi:hypothetical protein